MHVENFCMLIKKWNYCKHFDMIVQDDAEVRYVKIKGVYQMKPSKNPFLFFCEFNSLKVGKLLKINFKNWLIYLGLRNPY